MVEVVQWCALVCARLLGRDYMQADGHDEGGVSDMLIGLHNIITLQAFVDRIAVPDKNYAIWSSSLALLLSLPEYKPTLKELTLPQVLFCSRRSLFCWLMAKGLHVRVGLQFEFASAVASLFAITLYANFPFPLRKHDNINNCHCEGSVTMAL